MTQCRLSYYCNHQTRFNIEQKKFTWCKCRCNCGGCNSNCGTSSCGTPGGCDVDPCSSIAHCIADFKRILWINFAIIIAVSADQTRILLYQVLLTINKVIRPQKPMGKTKPSTVKPHNFGIPCERTTPNSEFTDRPRNYHKNENFIRTAHGICLCRAFIFPSQRHRRTTIYRHVLYIIDWLAQLVSCVFILFGKSADACAVVQIRSL